MSVSMRAVLLLILTVGTGSVISADEPQYYFLNKSERIPLTLTDKVLVPSGNNRPAAVSGDTGVARAAGWKSFRSASQAPANAGAPSASSVQSSVKEALSQPGVTFATPVFKGSSGFERAPTAKLLIVYADGVDPDAAFNKLKDQGLESQHLVGKSTIYEVTTNKDNGFDVLELSNALNKLPEIKLCQPNFLIQGKHNFIPNDPLFGESWALNNRASQVTDLNAPQAWDITTGSPSIIVLVLDDGVQQNHPDLNLVPGFDFIRGTDGGDHFTDYDRHGTAVAGCISGIINNGIGTAGIAPSVKVASGKFADTDEFGDWTSTDADLIDAILWSLTVGAKITNSSFGQFGDDPIVDEAYRQTRAAGVLHFASSGNEADNEMSYFPANSENVVAVGASNRYGSRATFSNFGQGLDFVAPGQEILTTDRTGSLGFGPGDYDTVDGTSFACPYAAGVAALIWTRFPSLTPDQVVEQMVNTCTDIGALGYDIQTGYGLLNAARAVSGLEIYLGPPAIKVTAGSREVRGGTNRLRTNTSFKTVEIDEEKLLPFAITNTGRGPLNIQSIGISRARGRFILWSKPESRILPGETSKFKILFRPNRAGKLTAKVVIRSDDPQQPVFTFAIGGRGKRVQN